MSCHRCLSYSHLSRLACFKTLSGSKIQNLPLLLAWKKLLHKHAAFWNKICLSNQTANQANNFEPEATQSFFKAKTH
jgi:hypothetical protein